MDKSEYNSKLQGTWSKLHELHAEICTIMDNLPSAQNNDSLSREWHMLHVAMQNVSLAATVIGESAGIASHDSELTDPSDDETEDGWTHYRAGNWFPQDRIPEGPNVK